MAGAHPGKTEDPSTAHRLERLLDRINGNVDVAVRGSPIANRDAHRSLPPPGRAPEPRTAVPLDVLDDFVGRLIMSATAPQKADKALIDDGPGQDFRAAQFSDICDKPPGMCAAPVDEILESSPSQGP
jgi:hypothetical protein